MLVATTCPACDRAHAWRVDDREPPAGGQVAHFLVPATRMWDDVVYPCGNQRIFCSEACVATWLNESGHQRGSVLDLQTLWRLAAGWYAGRLERGYVRREPRAAADYLGVSGSPAPSGASPRGDRRRAPVGVAVIRPRVSQLPTHRQRLDQPARPHLPNLLLVRRHPHLTRVTGRTGSRSVAQLCSRSPGVISARKSRPRAAA
jgi:hypothetical protein